MNLPQDDFILLSFVNTKLRDEYGSLSELCEELDVPRESVVARLEKLGYTYDQNSNSFKR